MPPLPDSRHVRSLDQLVAFMRDQLEAAELELEGAATDLKAANDELNRAHEELEATIEALDASNRESRSTKDALETMNQGLAASNRELRALHVELHQRTDEYDRAQLLFTSVIDALDEAVIVVDGDQTVRAWNQRSSELWGISAERAVGRKLDRLGSALPQTVRDFPAALVGSAVAAHAAPAIATLSAFEATDAQGRLTRFHVRHAPFGSTDGDTGGIMLFIAAAAVAAAG